MAFLMAALHKYLRTGSCGVRLTDTSVFFSNEITKILTQWWLLNIYFGQLHLRETIYHTVCTLGIMYLNNNFNNRSAFCLMRIKFIQHESCVCTIITHILNRAPSVDVLRLWWDFELLYVVVFIEYKILLEIIMYKCFTCNDFMSMVISLKLWIMDNNFPENMKKWKPCRCCKSSPCDRPCVICRLIPFPRFVMIHLSWA